MSEVIKLKITAADIDYSETVNAFPSTTKEATIEELRERMFENKKTQALWSKKLKQATLRYAYGNEYIRKGDSKDKKSKDFTLRTKFENEQHFNEHAADLTELQRTEIFSGKFDVEIKNISAKMSAARN